MKVRRSISFLIPKKSESSCDVCVVSQISTCKHFIIPRGAPNSEPNHTITGLVKKPPPLTFMYSLLIHLTIQQNNLYNLTLQCYRLQWPARPVRYRAEVVNGNFKFPNSSVDEEGADNHPHSSVPPSPHPQKLTLPRHDSIRSPASIRMCTFVMG